MFLGQNQAVNIFMMRASLAAKKSDVFRIITESSLRRAMLLFPYNKVELDFNMNCWSRQGLHEIFIHIFIR